MFTFRDKDNCIVHIKHKLILEIAEVDYSNSPNLKRLYKNVKSRVVVSYGSLSSAGYKKTMSSGVINNRILFSSEPAVELYERWKRKKKNKRK